jgi:predicted AlkP superfamily phosphohydrolase/phosphomutase
MIDDGADLDLVSTVPPDSGPAWTSFQTGLDPENHEIIDFTRIDENFDTQVNTLSSINRNHIWDILNNRGKKAIPINLPMMYPAEGKAPVAVSGLPAPGIDETSVQPPDILNELKREYPNYSVVPGTIGEYTEENIRTWLANAEQTVDEKFEFAMDIQSRQDPDVLMLHIHETDVVQHKLWDRLHPPTDQVTDFYANIDDRIGELSDRADNILILSDHGFRSNDFVVYLNTWLRRRGYLKAETKARTVSKLKQVAATVLPERVIEFYKESDTTVEDTVLGENLQKNIFKSDETSAFAHGVGRGKIYIKDWDVIDALVSDLEELTVNGEEIVDDITIYEEIDGPNVIVEPAEPYHFESTPDQPALVERIEKRDGNHIGTHDKEGVFISNGDFFDNPDKESISIVDVMPTILEAVDIPIPSRLDGEIRSDVLA